MFTTSMTATVVAGLLTSGSLGGLPEWTDSYGKAITQAGVKQKPVAVFLSAGEPTALTKGKGLGEAVMKSLKEKYIAVRIDTTTEHGKKMAAAFGVSEGVVLSDRTGKQMALKHIGTLSPDELSSYLAKYADVKEVVTTEVRSSVVAVPQYYPQQYAQPRPVLNAIQNIGGTIMSPFSGSS